MSWFGGVISAAVGTYPFGVVFKIESERIKNAPGVPDTVVRSSDILLDGVTIERWTGSSAIGINGDFVVLKDPVLRDPNDENSNGIRVPGGTGFRCYGGSVDAGGDAAIQFSAGRSGESIRAGAYIGTRVSARQGRLILIGTQFGDIEDIRLIGITGESSLGNLIQVQCFDAGTAGEPNPRIRRILFRDLSLRRVDGADPDEGVVVYDYGTGAGGGISDLLFDSARIENTGRTSLRVGSDSLTPVTGLDWRGGRVAHTGIPNPLGAAVSLARLERGSFAAVRIDTASDAVAAVSVGAGGACAGVVFADATLAGLAAGQVGVRFIDAAACGWERGAMRGDAGAVPARLAAASVGCFVTGANLTALAADVIVEAGTAAFRLGGNLGHAQRSPVNLGAPAVTPITAQAAAPASSVADLTYAGAGSLRTVGGGAPGDLLALTTREAIAVSVKDAGATGNLRLRGNCELGPDDTLLLRRGPGGDWAELARRDNG